jgi:hypothetical protein
MPGGVGGQQREPLPTRLEIQAPRNSYLVEVKEFEHFQCFCNIFKATNDICIGIVLG